MLFHVPTSQYLIIIISKYLILYSLSIVNLIFNRKRIIQILNGFLYVVSCNILFSSGHWHCHWHWQCIVTCDCIFFIFHHVPFLSIPSSEFSIHIIHHISWEKRCRWRATNDQLLCVLRIQCESRQYFFCRLWG